MTFRTSVVLVAAIAFAIVVFLWEFGADRILSRIGCFIIRIVTFNRVKIEPERIDDTAEMTIGAATLIFFVVAFIILTSLIY